MPVAQSAWPQFRLHFQQYMTAKAEKGLDGDLKAAEYVPSYVQREYWNDKKIQELCNSCGVSAETLIIRGGYVQILSILVSISTSENPMIHHINTFITHVQDDATLPLPPGPRAVFDKIQDPIFMERFLDNQWRFCPVIMDSDNSHRMSNRELDRKQVFPVTRDDSFGTDKQPREAELMKMDIHPEAKSTPQNSPLAQPIDKVIFKVYPNEQCQIFNLEREAYSALQNRRDHENILRCLGTFYWNTEDGRRRSTLMLEYTNQGSLLDLYQKNEPPLNSRDTNQFWNMFLCVIKGLDTMHNCKGIDTPYVVHQDLKPSNLLVFPKDSRDNDSRNKFSRKLKIGDFGCSSYLSSRQSPLAQDRGGTTTYGPPELFHADDTQYWATPGVDIWALGCILIEAAVWVCFGEFGRQLFRQQRMDETAQLPDHRGLGRRDCFHNGLYVLDCVKNVLSWVNQDGRKSDTVTPQIVYLMLTTALKDIDIRDGARQLRTKIRNILHDPATAGNPAAVPPGSQSMTPVTVAPPFSPGPFSPESIEPSLYNAPGSLPRMPTVNGTRDINSSYISSQEELPSPSYSYPTCNKRGVVPTDPYVTTTKLGTQPLSPEQLFTLPEHTLSRHSINGSRSLGSTSAVEQPSPPGQPPKASTSTTPDQNVRTSLPPFTLEELQDWIADHKQGNKRELPGWESAKRLLDGRDFFILVDNSRSMQYHRKAVLKAIGAMSYLFKMLDPDGIDVLCTSAPRKKKQCRTATTAVDFVKGKFSEGHSDDCHMEGALEALLSSVRDGWDSDGNSIRRAFATDHKPSLRYRGVSIYILTDGAWERTPDGVCGADNPIQTMIKQMKDRGIGRTQVSLQFAKFGDNPVGAQRLKKLDDDIFKASRNEDYDIVDCKPFDGDIWQLLIGSTSLAND